MRIGFIILTMFLLGTVSCKKFEEGPGFSLRTRTSRITGVWEIESYTVDGADSLASQNFETLEYVFGGKSCKYRVFGRNCTGCANAGAKWNFLGGDPTRMRFEYIAFDSPFSYSSSATSGVVWEIWEVRRLTNGEMILQSLPNLSSQTLRISLTKKSNDKVCE